jgi:cytochrome P450/NADPH-cytochrome P450 reductase
MPVLSYLLGALLLFSGIVFFVLYQNVIKYIRFVLWNKNRIPVLPMKFGVGQLLDYIYPLQLFDRVLAYTRNITDYRGIYTMTFAFYPVIVISDPELVKQVAITKASKFKKNEQTYKILKLALGNGLVTLEGEEWKRDRNLLNPVFSSHNIAAMMDKMFEQTEHHIADWKQHVPVNDIQHSISQLTLKIVASCVYGSSQYLEDHSGQISTVYKDILSNLLFIFAQGMVSEKLWKLPIPSNTKFNSNLNKINSLVLKLIKQKKKHPHDSNNVDLLSLMLTARDENYSLSDQSIIAESTTFVSSVFYTVTNNSYLLVMKPLVHY